MKIRTAEHLAPYRQKGPKDYTAEECGIIETMVKQGYSASQIASVVGRSRNAIVSFVHRHLHDSGIRLRGTTSNPRPSSPHERKARPALTQKRAPRPRLRAGIPVPDALLIQLEDLRNDQCRWPIGDVGEPGFGFCGHAKFRGSYCEAHAARSAFACA